MFSAYTYSTEICRTSANFGIVELAGTVFDLLIIYVKVVYTSPGWIDPAGWQYYQTPHNFRLL